MMVRTLGYVYKMSFLSGLIAVLSASLSIENSGNGLYAAILLMISGFIQMAMSIFTWVRKGELPKGFDQCLLVILTVTSLICVLDWYVNGVNILVELTINIFCAILIIIVLYEKKKYGHKESNDSEISDT